MAARSRAGDRDRLGNRICIRNQVRNIEYAAGIYSDSARFTGGWRKVGQCSCRQRAGDRETRLLVILATGQVDRRDGISVRGSDRDDIGPGPGLGCSEGHDIAARGGTPPRPGGPCGVQSVVTFQSALWPAFHT